MKNGAQNTSGTSSAEASAAFIIFFCSILLLFLAQAILIPFVIAVFVWYLINAVARLLRSFKLRGYGLPKTASLIISCLFFICLLYFAFALMRGNITEVARAAPTYQKNLQPVLDRAVLFLGLDHQPTLTEIASHIDIEHGIKLLAALFTGLAGKTLTVLFYVGFLLYEQKYFDKKIIAMIENQKTEDKVRDILKKIDVKIQRYIGVKSFVSAVDSLITFTILSVAGVDFAEFWGLAAFFLHFIPYAGSFVAISMPSTIALIQSGDPATFFIVLGCLSFSHAMIGHILDPFLMGNNLNLSPIFIITSLALWALIWGIPGIFLAIPILAVITIVLSEFDATRPLAILLSKTGRINQDHK